MQTFSDTICFMPVVFLSYNGGDANEIGKNILDAAIFAAYSAASVFENAGPGAGNGTIEK